MPSPAPDPPYAARPSGPRQPGCAQIRSLRGLRGERHLRIRRINAYVRLTHESLAARRHGTGGSADVNKVVLRQQAEDGLRHDLQQGERIAAGSAVTCDPSRWGAAALLVVSLALIAASLASLLGPWPASPVVALALPVLALGIQFLPRPLHLVVTDRRQPGIPASRHARAEGIRRAARGPADPELPVRQVRSFAPVRDSRPQAHPAALGPGRAHGLRRGRKSAGALGRVREAGSPYPSAENISTAAYRH